MFLAQFPTILLGAHMRLIRLPSRRCYLGAACTFMLLCLPAHAFGLPDRVDKRATAKDVLARVRAFAARRSGCLESFRASGARGELILTAYESPPQGMEVRVSMDGDTVGVVSCLSAELTKVFGSDRLTFRADRPLASEELRVGTDPGVAVLEDEPSSPSTTGGTERTDDLKTIGCHGCSSGARPFVTWILGSFAALTFRPRRNRKQ